MKAVGMLWFDNDNKVDLTTKIIKATDYYVNKYGNKPNVCYVHPSMVPPTEDKPETEENNVVTLNTSGVEVRTTRSVLPNHLWLGINGINGDATG